MIFRNFPSAFTIVAMLLFAPTSWGADEQQIQRAIARGLEHLKDRQDPVAGTWPSYETFAGPAKTGATALAGVTMLECGVPSDDPVVKKAASAVRQASVSLTQTYELSTAILFLDRLGDPRDVSLIQSMAVRLLGGQTSTGGWSYECPPPGRQEVARLTAHLRKPDEGAKPIAKVLTGGRDRRTLPPEIQAQLRVVNAGGFGQTWSDNSNTKFATLALWVARRHGIPVEQSASNGRSPVSHEPEPGRRLGLRARQRRCKAAEIPGTRIAWVSRVDDLCGFARARYRPRGCK